MKQEILNLVDKIIGKKGIMRSPAWWVNRIFKKTLDYVDEVGSNKEDKIPTLYIGSSPENEKIYNGIMSGEIDRCKIEYTDTTNGLEAPIRAISTAVAIVPNFGVSVLFDSVENPNKSKSVVIYAASPKVASESVRTSSNLYNVYARNLGSDPDPTYWRRKANKEFIDAVVSGDAQGCIVHNVDTGHTYTSTNFDVITNSEGEKEVHIMMTFCEGNIVNPRPLQVAGVIVTPDGSAAHASQYPSISSIPIIDNLESESTTAALSANQGRVLNKRFCQLPSGLFNSDSDNWYKLTAEEIDEIEKTIDGAALYFINHKEGKTYTSIPLTFRLDDDGFWVFTGTQTRVTTLDSGAIRITMTVWEFIFPIIYFQGYMKKTEQVIYESTV